MVSQITSLTTVYSAAHSDPDQRKHESSASLAFVWGIHRWPVNSPHNWPVTRKMFPFDDVIILVTGGREAVTLCDIRPKCFLHPKFAKSRFPVTNCSFLKSLRNSEQNNLRNFQMGISYCNSPWDNSVFQLGCAQFLCWISFVDQV